jgi:putative ABC transport system substrate-binding protein
MTIKQTGPVLALLFGLFTGSLSAAGQQPAKAPLIGILSDETPSLGAKSFEPFAQGLQDLGWVEGQNLTIERRYSEGNNKILAELAAEVVQLQPDVILAIGTPAGRRLKWQPRRFQSSSPGRPIPLA